MRVIRHLAAVAALTTGACSQPKAADEISQEHIGRVNVLIDSKLEAAAIEHEKEHRRLSERVDVIKARVEVADVDKKEPISAVEDVRADLFE